GADVVGILAGHVVSHGHHALAAVNHLIKTTEYRMLARSVIGNTELVIFNAAGGEVRRTASQFTNDSLVWTAIDRVGRHQSARPCYQGSPVDAQHVSLNITVTHTRFSVSASDAHLTDQRATVVKVQLDAAIVGFFFVVVDLSK